MFKTIFSAIIAMICLGLGAVDMADLPIGYHSSGRDFYRDGTPVLDGECYALVWLREGVEFAGFQRDGQLVDAANAELVFVEPLAENGRCPPVNFAVPADFAQDHKKGLYRVVLLDTRRANGEVGGLDENGRLWRVKSWGWANVKEDDAKSSRRSFASVGAFADILAQMPKDLTNPVITSIRVTDDVVTVGVKKTRRYIDYRLAAGTDPAAVNTAAGEPVEGAAGDCDTLELTVRRQDLANPEGTFFGVRGE